MAYDDKGKRKNQGLRPQMSIYLTVEAASQKEVKIKAHLVNSFRERLLRFTVNGNVLDNAIQPTENKEIVYSFQPPKGANSLRIQVKTIEPPYVFDEIEVSPTESIKRKQKKPLTIGIVASATKGSVMTIVIARVNENNDGVPGEIFFLDARPGSEKEPRLYKRKTKPDGYTIIDFELGEKKREVVFFAPEKPKETIIKEIPAKPSDAKNVGVKEKISETQSQRSLKVQILNAYRQGRKQKGGVANDQLD